MASPRPSARLGTTSRPNRRHGVHVTTFPWLAFPTVSSLANVIGLNLIGNNVGDGIRLEGEAPFFVNSHTILANNIIGHVAHPNPALDSDGSGVTLRGNAQSNT